MAYNYITKTEYTGKNAAILEMIGVRKVVTFKQALSLPGVSGKTMKGLKACAKLVRFSKRLDADGEVTKKPIFFSVFDADAILARIA